MTRVLTAAAAALAAVLLFAALACNGREQPNEAEMLPAPRWTIPAAPEPRATQLPCDAWAQDHAEAVQTLHVITTRPECLDAAVAALQRLAAVHKDGRLLSDLAAAYYIRANHDGGRTDDLLSALDTAESAVAVAPKLAEGRFNRALIQEAIGLDEAAASWQAAAAGSPWADEAQQRRAMLERAAAERAATQWQPERIRAIAAQGGNAALATLVARHPSAARRFVEDELLPEWAQAPPERAHAVLALARTIGSQIATKCRDPYLRNSVAAIQNASPAALPSLREAILALREGRQLERVTPKIAVVHYGRAQRLFLQARNPLWMSARLGQIIFAGARPPQLVGMLLVLERAADEHGYLILKANIESNLGHFLPALGRYVEAAEHYDRAISIAASMHDGDAVTMFRVRKAGILRRAGLVDAAARDAFLALRDVSALPTVPERHLVLGEAAESALALRHPRIALLYIQKDVDLLQGALANPRQASTGLHQSLVIALRTRAAAELATGLMDDAIRDVNEAIRLTGGTDVGDESVRRVLLARTYESVGQAAISRHEYRKAADAYGEALRQALPKEYRTYRASLLIQRAEAYTGAGLRRRAVQDLVEAVREIREEEQALLERRTRGYHEVFWNSYFSRFREAYDALIRHLMQAKEYKRAFAYAESFKAYEPLNLVLQPDVAPESFRRWAGDGGTHDVREIQRHLDPNQYLVAFHVLPEHTVAWIIGAERFETLELPATKDAIEEWNSALRRYDGESNTVLFEETLERAHDGLLREPLKRIRALQGDAKISRIIFVPDRGIHGLPLAALRDHQTQRYVVEDSIVSMTPSATLFVFSRERDAILAAAHDRSALVIGDPAFNPHLELARGLESLKRARIEAAKIAGLYAPRARLLEAEQATVPAFVTGASDNAIVHFAGHAISNPREPFRSVLLLAGGGGHSGALQAEELLKTLKVGRTRLLVLASCSSSGGVAVGPEGLAPLVRPFMTSGVPAVVGTLWNVRDEYSEAVLVAFHEHYRRGLDAESALREAQLGVIGKGNRLFRSPLVWAPFQVIGHAESPFRPQP